MPPSKQVQKSDAVRLKYIGGGAFLTGVPAADLVVSPEEVAALTASGLYQRSDAPEAMPAPANEEGGE